jgi:hypothetical protein
LSRAEAHFSAAEVIHRHNEYPWATVALFYAGMHLIHAGLPALAHLSVAQQHPESHDGSTFQAEGTNVIVRRYVQHLHTQYKSLFSASIDVRYNGNPTTRAEAENHRRIDLPPIAAWACEQIHADPSCGCWLRAM